MSGMLAVHLRYRPLGDVLLGEVMHDGGAADADTRTWVETIDADVDLRWSGHGGREVLSAWRVVHARARWHDDPIDLPLASVCDLADLFARADRTSNDSLAARARAVVTVEALVPIPVLDREVVRHGASVSTPASGEVVRSLLLVADAVEEAARLASGHDQVRTVRLVGALREMVDVLRRHPGRPAPGPAIAALRLVAGGLPLTAAERVELRSALGRCLHPDSWSTLAGDLADLAMRLSPWSAVVGPGAVADRGC